ncbi:hypothetical protein E1293_23815 [Actinomadura darangshiensis]|uniref:Nbr1 FW domain-containing protein n=1 Tax=Actinomadura darangshiensis TaxID=705336 RepID=A0A4R5B2D1_9ACTN|nr:NBR1-Ig-like domain-containing protein [Actinomadura darangshiensis]TDD79305.1 hypothetical protein E1293_23815 [Actinomadura darangshiensis]
MSGAARDPRKVRAGAIADFAARLRELRDSVGTPSFREMAACSRAISHTTLHEAAQGHRLPSWATTVEFIKACDADPEAYRDSWEDANRVVREASAGAREQARLDGPSPAEQSGTRDEEPAAADADAAADDDPGDEQPDVAKHVLSRRRYVVLGTVVAGAAATLIGTFLLTDAEGNSTSPAERQVSSADCPVRQPNPPSSPPAHQGDGAAFVADITLPDCTHVPRGGTVTKVWRFKNSGTVAWHGYTLHRIDLPQRRDQCQTIVDVPIPDTPPGEVVDVRAQVSAPPGQAFCFVRFKMHDGDGAVAFPASRPVNFQIVVD